LVAIGDFVTEKVYLFVDKEPRTTPEPVKEKGKLWPTRKRLLNN
jgi:hypothetical protein